MSQLRLRLPVEALADFCRRHKIRRMSVFGSALRDDFTTDSDVDFLVEFQPDAHASLFRLVEMERELTDLLGRDADLNTPMDLSPYFRNEVLAKAELIYATP